MRLADSKIFPGNDRTLDPRKPVREQRKIFVYVPAAYKDGTQGAHARNAGRAEPPQPGAQCSG